MPASSWSRSRDVDRVVLELGDVGGAELTASGSGHADDQPRRMGMRAHDARRKAAAEPRRRLGHEALAKAICAGRVADEDRVLRRWTDSALAHLFGKRPEQECPAR